MTARDRKLVMILVPAAIFALYWLLLMNPALDRRADLERPLAEAQTQRDAAVAEAQRMVEAKENYEQDYSELVKLSKAIPQAVAVSELMRELNSAAEGMDISFSNISMASAAQAAAGAAPTALTPGAEGLDQIPVELTFDGRFFALSDLFESVQKFVQVADGKLEVQGRLIRVDEFSFDSASFPNITAQIKATIYAAPATEGPTGGATPVGPPGAERGDGGLEPVENFAPAATVTP
ncbi:MAG TPA: type II secretion system protein GspM [Thermoleophilaceae bacterium]|nr:type II secretion system protein GspM [Thermoleophilaceae bacterium]